MTDMKTGRDWFYSQEKEAVDGVKQCDAVSIYRLKYTGQYVCEIRINSGLGGEATEINQITDIHFNYASLDDAGDREIEGTVQKRKWNMEAASVCSAVKAMELAAFADQTVVTGDTLDFLSKGGIMLTKKHIIEKDPQILMALGGHDYTKQMQTGLPNELSADIRLAAVAEFWPHDIHYCSKRVGDKVLAVCLDNSSGKFHESVACRLQRDIEDARGERRIVLAFMHEPIATKSGLGEIDALWVMDGAPRKCDFDSAETVGSGEKDAAYEILRGNADVVRGVFCGHMHSAFYTEIRGSYTDENGTHPAQIPQFCAPGNPYLGHSGIVTRIIVE